MKINLFYVVAGGAVITGSWLVYTTYFQPANVPSSSKLAAAALISNSAETSTVPTTSVIAAITTTTPTAPPAAAPVIAASSALTPSVPTGLAAIAITSSTIDLSWGASFDAAGVAGYKIFMNGKQVGATPAQRFEAAKLTASTAYSFTVAAYDQKGVASKQSAAITATTTSATAASSSTPSSTASTSTTSATTSAADTTPPSTPAGLTASVISSSEIDLSWTAATDNVGVTGYEIIVNGTFTATANGTTYHDTGLTAGTAYTFAVAAYDAASNVGPRSTTANATTQSSSSGSNNNNNNDNTSTADTTAPTATITSPTANATASGTITVNVSASDNIGVTKVELYTDGTLKGTDTASPYAFSLNTTSLSNGTHSLAAKSYDAAGNVGNSSAITITVANATATTTPTSTTSAAPSAPKNLAATAVSSSEIDLTWTAPSSPSSGITGYQIFRNGHPIAQNTSTGYHDTGLTAGTTYSYTVRAFIGTPADNAGTQSTSTSAKTSGG